MNILRGDIIKQMTGCVQIRGQEQWFRDRGYKFEKTKNGQIWTTDDWMNGRDKLLMADNDDGFNLSVLDEVKKIA